MPEPGTEGGRLRELRAVAPVPGQRVHIGAQVWAEYQAALAALRDAEEIRDRREMSIREADPAASVIIVDGTKVAVRVVQDVTGASWRKDYYRRTGKATS